MAFRVVYGPPCSGKSTYIREHRGKKDVCFEYDGALALLTGVTEHVSDDSRDYAFRFAKALRSTYITVAKDGDHEAENLWMTTTRVDDRLREKLADLDPEYILMDVSEEECLERLEGDDTCPDKDGWRRIIHRWFDENADVMEEKRMRPIDKYDFKGQAQARAMPLLASADTRRLDTERYVEGYAANYQTYLLYDGGDWGKMYERFERGCFDGCDMSDVILQFDHAGRVFARNSNGTLLVEPNDTGLFMAADLNRTELARQLYEDISAGMITKMSWRFLPGEYRTEETRGGKDYTIVHTRIKKIYDVSAVSIPANDTTEINARDFAHGVMSEIARREAELEERRRKLALRIRLPSKTAENNNN